MTRAKVVAKKAPRAARPKRTAATPADRGEPVIRVVDEVVEAAIDDMVGQLTESPSAFADVPYEASIASDHGKQKLVRDSFTMPKNEYQTLDVLKTRLLRLSHSAKKSELLRAGVASLGRMSDSQLLAAIAVVPNLKTGRPKGKKSGVDGSKKKGSTAQ